MHTGLATATQSGSGIGSLLLLVLPLALLAILMYSQRRRTRAIANVQASLGVGEEVVTTSGMIGRIAWLDERTAILEVAPGVQVRFDRRAIGARYQPDGPLAETADPETPDAEIIDTDAEYAADTRRSADGDPTTPRPAATEQPGTTTPGTTTPGTTTPGTEPPAGATDQGR